MPFLRELRARVRADNIFLLQNISKSFRYSYGLTSLAKSIEPSEWSEKDLNPNLVKGIYAALFSVGGLCAVALGIGIPASSVQRSICQESIPEDSNFPRPRFLLEPAKKNIDPEKPFTRHSIADAASKALPAVAHLSVTIGHGFFTTQSEGSGFIIQSDGVLLTNAHVVAEASGINDERRGKLQVMLQDGRSFEGRVLCLDTLSDIALVKIQTPGPLPTLEIGDSKSLRPGDWVVALGSALHLSNSVTAGIISCTDRKSSELGLRGARIDYLQTDAAINRGNSGGPLVNLEGQVVGINCMKAFAADGVGFAIPIESALKVVNQLLKNGRVIRPFVGVKMLDLNPWLIEQIKAKSPDFPDIDSGVLVPNVVPGSPADRAGIVAGDIIVMFGGVAVSSSREIIDVLEDKVGIAFNVGIKRANNVTLVVRVVPEETVSPA